MANKKKAQPTGKSSQKNAKAAAKVRAAQQQKRQRMQWSVGIIALVVVGIVVLVLVKISTSNSKTSSAAGLERQDAPASIATDLAAVPISTITAANAARLKSDSNFKDLAKVNEAALSKGGKPEVLYMGAEYCPYCAAERWALTVALSKFGTFSGLKTVSSSSSDSPAEVPTLSYYGSSYKSPYLTFNPVELQDRENKPLETPTAAETKLLTDHGGSYPFIDFGGSYIQSGASVDTSVLLGKKQVDIAKEINGKGNTSAQVNAAAGSFVKAICALTDGKPGDVCTPVSAG